ncbi:type IV fimbrial biogenesis protein FimU [Pseudomonas sp. TE3786]
MSVSADVTVAAIYRRRPKAQGAFSLVELLVVVVLLAIFAAIAIPSFTRLTHSNQALAAANELYGVLQYARSEALSRGRGVTVSVSASDAWAGEITVKAGSETLRHYAKGLFGNASASSSLAAMTFCPGFLAASTCSNGALSSPPTLTVGYADDSSVTTRTIKVLASGQITRPAISQ